MPVADLVRVAQQRTRRPTLAVAPPRRRAVQENGEFVALALLAQDWDSIAPWLIEELFDDDVYRRAFRALADADGNLDAAIGAGRSRGAGGAGHGRQSPTSTVEPEIEARNLIAAAVRRELAPHRGDVGLWSGSETIVTLVFTSKSWADPISSASASEWLLGWLHRRTDERAVGGS